MSRICRVISTFLIAAGLGFVCFYTYTQSTDNKFTVFSKPSYYVLQNYWYIFLAGIAVLFFSLIGSFFSWFKEIEEKEEILPNAGYASKKDIAGWVGGTSLDTTKMTEQSQGNITQYSDKTEVLMDDDKTEILSQEEQIELIKKMDATEVLEEDQTEILGGKVWEEKR